MIVIMVHGFAESGRRFWRMRGLLEAAGHACFVPKLSPRDGRLGIADLSSKLADFVSAGVPAEGTIAFVGFSMGALVVRHYLQSGGAAGRARAFFSISGPHQGTWIAYLYPGLGTRQMRPGSAFLRELDAGLPLLRGVVLHTYRTPVDLMVAPSTRARIPGVAEQVVWCAFHSHMQGHHRVMGHVAAEIARIDASGPPGRGGA